MFPGDQHVQRFALLDVLDSLLVRDEREIVAVDLEDLVVNSEIRAGGRAVGFNDCDINTLQTYTKTVREGCPSRSRSCSLWAYIVWILLWAEIVVHVDATADAEAAVVDGLAGLVQNRLAVAVEQLLFRNLDRNLLKRPKECKRDERQDRTGQLRLEQQQQHLH